MGKTASEKDEIVIIDTETLLNNDSSFRYNVLTNNVEYKPKGGSKYEPVDQFAINSLMRRIAKLRQPHKESTIRQTIYSDYTPKYHPVRGFYKIVPKYTGDRDPIDEIARLVKTTNDELFRWFFKKWFVAMIASGLYDDFVNHVALVLVGGQGVGKSRFIASLVPEELQDYYNSGTLNLRNKETLLMLSKMFLICMDELHISTDRQCAELKEIITKKEIVLKTMRAHSCEKFPRLASFAITANDFDFMIDSTGSRRLACFEVLEIDNETPKPIHEAYSQALHLIENDFDYIFRDQDNERLELNNSRYQYIHPIEELLLRYFERADGRKKTYYLSNTVILQKLAGESSIKITNSNKKTLGQILKKLDFKRTTRMGRKVYAVQIIEPNEVSRDDRKYDHR